MQLSHRLAPQVQQLNSSPCRISFLQAPHSIVPLTSWNIRKFHSVGVRTKENEAIPA